MPDYRFANIESNQDNRNLLTIKDKCDKYDYIAAVACGTIGGMIDVFLVGAPLDSTLGKWTDDQVDQVIMSFSKKMGWKPNTGNENNVRSAIGYLERNFEVKYDQRKPCDVGGMFNIAPNTHHMMSLAHSPDVIGLFFSILNQFTSTSSFVVEGQLITVKSDDFELQGGNFPAKIFCGAANWFGHLMSDFAGSSGTHKRGTGIVMPFYELFGMCKFGQFNTRNGKKDLAEIALSAFTQGYDLRFGITMAIPVLLTELLIKLIWSLRRYFGYGYSLKECIPSQKYDDLRIMLLIGYGTLCLIDGADAAIRSNGNFVTFFMRMNLVAWCRFTMLVLKEVCLRVGLQSAIQKQIEALERINDALLAYLDELEKLDIELFKAETAKYKTTVMVIKGATSEKELNEILLNEFEKLGIIKPWQGEFDKHMANKNATLVFK